MAITVWMDVESRIDKFFCLSTDDKPTGVPIGSILYTIDTLVWYITYNGTDWVEKKSEGIDLTGIDAVIDDEAILAAVGVVDGVVDDILLDTEEIQGDTYTIIADTEDIQSTVNDIESDVATVDAAVAVVDTVVDAIKVVTDALPTLTETGGTVGASGTETDVYVNNAPSGVFKPIALKIDFTNHTAAETVMITEYYRIKSGGGWLKEDYVVFEGLLANDQDSIVVDFNPNRYGVKVTIEKGAGTDRDYEWEVFYEVV